MDEDLRRGTDDGGGLFEVGPPGVPGVPGTAGVPVAPGVPGTAGVPGAAGPPAPPGAAGLLGPPGPSPEAGEWAVPGVERPPPPLALPEELAGLPVLLEALGRLDPSACDGDVVLAGCQAFLQASEQLRVLRARWLAEVDARRLHRLAGSGSTRRWLREVDPAGQAAPGARDQVTLARRLKRFGVLAARVQAGAVSAAAAATVGTVLERMAGAVDRPDGLVDGQDAEQALSGVIGDGVPSALARMWGGGADERRLADLREQAARILASDGTQLERLEQAVVLLAEHADPAHLRPALAELTDALLPEQLALREQRAYERRCLKLTARTDGPGWSLSGQLDAECGERLHTLLDAELLRDPDAPLDTAAANALREQGLDPYDDELAPTLTPRTTAERTHDALSAALGRLLAAGLGGTVDRQPVQVTVDVTPETLERLPGALPARTGSGTRVPLALVQSWACGGVFTRHVLSLAGRVLESSRSARTLNRAERRALRTQSGGQCQGAGCGRGRGRPGTVLHPHHATPYALTGRTSLQDTVHLCDRCHRYVHHGHVLRLTDGRRLGPHGWVADGPD